MGMHPLYTGVPRQTGMHPLYTGVPKYKGMHSHLLGYPSIWGCTPIHWGNPESQVRMTRCRTTEQDSYKDLEVLVKTCETRRGQFSRTKRDHYLPTNNNNSKNTYVFQQTSKNRCYAGFGTSGAFSNKCRTNEFRIGLRDPRIRIQHKRL